MYQVWSDIICPIIAMVGVSSLVIMLFIMGFFKLLTIFKKIYKEYRD